MGDGSNKLVCDLSDLQETEGPSINSTQTAQSLPFLSTSVCLYSVLLTNNYLHIISISHQQISQPNLIPITSRRARGGQHRQRRQINIQIAGICLLSVVELEMENVLTL